MISNKDLLWIYLYEFKNKTYGITTSTSRYLELRTKNKKLYRVSMKKLDTINEAIEQYAKSFPHIIIGYHCDLKKPMIKILRNS